MIAWKLTTDFDEQRHLFFDKIKTDYIVEAYICSCGHSDLIINHPNQELKYCCQECENSEFHDANNAWNNIGHFVVQNSSLELSYEYDMQSSEEYIDSLYVIEIPNKIDLCTRKIMFSKKPVYSLTLTSDGQLKENYLLKFNQKIMSELENNLTEYINKNCCFDILDSTYKDLTLKMASFFLKNQNLRDFNFYYWADIDMLQGNEIYVNDALELIANYPKEKSIKKAVYQNYLTQLDNNGRFDSSFMEAFCKNIKDINILAKLLKLKLEYSIYSNIDKKGLNEIIVFLKRHYSEKQLLRFFSSKEFNSNHYLFRDTVSEFLYDKDVIENKFRKVSCKVQALHDEFVRCLREERHKIMQNQRLSYSKKDMKLCIEVNTYQVKLPKSGKELFDWADELHNCMAMYFEMIKNHETIIYCFFQEDVLVFAVEICDNAVVQASGKYNADLTVKENQVLIKWLELFFQKDKQRLENVA